MDHVIETDNLTKQWGELVAVNDLTLTVRTGECYAFLGRNGSGKSTTARLLLDFIRPTRVLATAPLFDLTSATTVTIDGTPVTNPGVGLSNVAAGTFAAFSVATGVSGIAFLVGGLTGKKGRAIGVATAIAVASYVFYTLANLTGVAKPLTWLSSWRWYMARAMFINGLSWEVVLPFALAAACGGLAWVAFERRDLQTA
jgi:energy-coupling factor transporter ATP-binding protein EcfA2